MRGSLPLVDAYLQTGLRTDASLSTEKTRLRSRALVERKRTNFVVVLGGPTELESKEAEMRIIGVDLHTLVAVQTDCLMLYLARSFLCLLDSPDIRITAG